MYNCCSGFGVKNFRDKFNVETESTNKGVKLHIMPKDESKVHSFQKFVEACNDFCDGENCC